MAQPAVPKLDVARDTQPYAPVSWAAVAAITTAVLFILLLVFYGLQSFLKKQPLLYEMFVGLPILTLILAFVGWMHIRKSERTRTGMKLAVYAFWIGLVGLLGYGSYLFAISMAVRNDSEKQFTDWVKDLNDLDPENPGDPALYRVFHKTLQPGLRQTVAPSDIGAMDRRFGTQIAVFRQTDLIGLCMRNRGKCQFTPHGLVDWSMTPKTVQSPALLDATVACTLECPEGVYHLKAPMKGTTDDAGRREWQVAPTAMSQVQLVRLTDYGRRIIELKVVGTQAADRFFSFAQDPSKQDRGYRLFVKAPYTVAAENTYVQKEIPPPAAWAVVGAMCFVDRSVIGYETDLVEKLFDPKLGPDVPKAPEDRKKMETEMRKTFAYVWNSGRMRKPGTLIRDNPEKEALLIVGENRIELRYPIELSLPGGEASANTARGRIVFACDDPAVIEEVRAKRASANPADATDATAALPNWIPLNSSWKLVRIESDLNPVPVAPQGEAEMMPQGMGGPGG